MPIVGENFLPLILAIFFCILGIGLLCVALFVIKRPKKDDAAKQRCDSNNDSIDNAGLQSDVKRGRSVSQSTQNSTQNNPRNVAYDRNARLNSQQNAGSTSQATSRGKHQR